MKAPRRRERDESRKFKDLGSLQRMGEALGFGRMEHKGNTYATNDKQEYQAQMLKNVGAFDEAARIDRQGKVGQGYAHVTSGPSPLFYGKKLDSDARTDEDRRAMHDLREEGRTKDNARKRQKGLAPVVQINTDPSKN